MYRICHVHIFTYPLLALNNIPATHDTLVLWSPDSITTVCSIPYTYTHSLIHFYWIFQSTTFMKNNDTIDHKNNNKRLIILSRGSGGVG